MLKIMAVCGHGQGSSMILKMTLDSVLNDMGFDAMLDCTSVAEAQGAMMHCDIVLTTAALAKIIDVPEGKHLITVNNLMDAKEVGEKVLAVVKEFYPQMMK